MTMNPMPSGSAPHMNDCDACGASGTVTSSTETQVFAYGEPGQEVELSATVPTWTCSACGFAYTDEAGEEARHEAVCRHLGVLTPHEIREIRERQGLSQAAFAKLTRFGEASIKRWEAGLVIQNASADQFLRLLRDPHVVERLSRTAPSPSPSDTTPSKIVRFRTELPSSAKKSARTFQLRAAVA